MTDIHVKAADFPLTLDITAFTGAAIAVLDIILDPDAPPPPVLTVPGPVQNLTATLGADGTSAVLSWSPPASDGGSPVIDYLVVGSGLGSSAVTALTLTAPALAPGTYGFTVTARNAVGPGLGIATSLTIPPPVIPPSPYPTVPPGLASGAMTLQQAFDLGVPFGIPPRVYAEQITVTKPVTAVAVAPGVIIDGTGKSWWLVVEADDVFLDGHGNHIVMRNGGRPTRYGALRVGDRRNRAHFADIELTGSGYANFAFGGGNDGLFENIDSHHGGGLAAHGGLGNGGGTQGYRNHLLGCKFHDSNLANAFHSDYEAGGMKATVQVDLIVEACEAFGNHGPGLWSDIPTAAQQGGHGTKWLRNKSHDNFGPGIMEEVSFGGLIDGNACWGNGIDNTGGTFAQAWWGPGILVASSTGTEVRNNVTARNRSAGITILGASRTDYPSVMPYQNINVHDNTDAASDGHAAIWWVNQGPYTRLLDPTLHNIGTINRYWFPTPEDTRNRFLMDAPGPFSKIAGYAATPQGTFASYLTTAQKDAILTAAGVPLA